MRFLCMSFVSLTSRDKFIGEGMTVSSRCNKSVDDKNSKGFQHTVE